MPTVAWLVYFLARLCECATTIMMSLMPGQATRQPISMSLNAGANYVALPRVCAAGLENRGRGEQGA